jgi:hypothetical protein
MQHGTPAASRRYFVANFDGIVKLSSGTCSLLTVVAIANYELDAAWARSKGLEQSRRQSVRPQRASKVPNASCTSELHRAALDVVAAVGTIVSDLHRLPTFLMDEGGLAVHVTRPPGGQRPHYHA